MISTITIKEIPGGEGLGIFAGNRQIGWLREYDHKQMFVTSIAYPELTMTRNYPFERFAVDIQEALEKFVLELSTNVDISEA